jgi:hypothetical protein
MESYKNETIKNSPSVSGKLGSRSRLGSFRARKKVCKCNMENSFGANVIKRFCP